jgi:hypothetical protein
MSQLPQLDPLSAERRNDARRQQAEDKRGDENHKHEDTRQDIAEPKRQYLVEAWLDIRNDGRERRHA